MVETYRGVTIDPYGYGNVIIGENPRFEVGAIIGGQPTLLRRGGEVIPALMGVEIGDDVWVGHNSLIMNGKERPTKLGNNVKIGPLSVVGHDSIVHDNARILSAGYIAGFVELGEGAVLGIGVTVRNRIKIGKGALVGMGSVVVKDVPPYSVAYGNPCRVNRKKSTERWIRRKVEELGLL